MRDPSTLPNPTRRHALAMLAAAAVAPAIPAEPISINGRGLRAMEGQCPWDDCMWPFCTQSCPDQDKAVLAREQIAQADAAR